MEYRASNNVSRSSVPRGNRARAVRSKLMIDGTMNTGRLRKYCSGICNIPIERVACNWIRERSMNELEVTTFGILHVAARVSVRRQP